MENSYKPYMLGRSIAELENYLLHPEKFNPDATAAAIEELKNRGRAFSEDELAPIQLIIDKKLEERRAVEQEEIATYESRYASVDSSEDLPMYYSNRAIYFFSIFFSVIFGAALLAVNVWGNKQARWNVIGFGFLYSVAAVAVLNLLGITSVWSVIFNAIGGTILTSYFWNKYIGLATKYESKSVWKPLIISLIVCAPFVIAALYTMDMAALK